MSEDKATGVPEEPCASDYVDAQFGDAAYATDYDKFVSALKTYATKKERELAESQAEAKEYKENGERLLAAADSWKAEAQREREARQSVNAVFVEERGVREPCESCGGHGVRVYGSTATWRGGIGGQAMTTYVCDVCWGSGDQINHWPSHREFYGLKRRAEKAEARCMEGLASLMLCHALATGHGDTMEDLLNELDWQLKEREARCRELEALLAGILDTYATVLSPQMCAAIDAAMLDEREKK